MRSPPNPPQWIAAAHGIEPVGSLQLMSPKPTGSPYRMKSPQRTSRVTQLRCRALLPEACTRPRPSGGSSRSSAACRCRSSLRTAPGWRPAAAGSAPTPSGTPRTRPPSRYERLVGVSRGGHRRRSAPMSPLQQWGAGDAPTWRGLGVCDGGHQWSCAPEHGVPSQHASGPLISQPPTRALRCG